MGRLEDIAERNRDPKAAAKKAKAAAKAKDAENTAGVTPSPPEDRLANIIDRNRNPKTRQGFFAGVGIAVFLLFILGLMVFTDLGRRPVEPKPAPVDHSGDKRVNDVKLR